MPWRSAAVQREPVAPPGALPGRPLSPLSSGWAILAGTRQRIDLTAVPGCAQGL